MSLLCCVEKCVTRQRVTSPNILEYANEKRGKGTFNNIIIEVGSETIAANRMILSCCSRFFEGMFDLELKEKYHNPVQINGVDGKAVKALVDFLYCGEVEINDENVMELLAASDYLQVGEVKLFCFEFLKSILSINNWFVICRAATLYQHEDLQNHVHAFVSIHLSKVIETIEFKLLSKSDLVSCYSKLDRAHTHEIKIFQGLINWIKYNEVAQKSDFLALFQQFIVLEKVPNELLKSIILKEDLVAKNFECLQLVTSFLIERIQLFDKTSTSASKMISLGGSKTLSTCFELYSSSSKFSKPSNFSWLPLGLERHCSLKSGNCIYLIGGCNLDDSIIASSKVWRLEVDNNLNWAETCGLNCKRFSMGATVFRDKLVVAGGFDGEEQLSSVESFESTLNEWKTGSPLQHARGGCNLVACNGFLYVLGGCCDGETLSSVERLSDLEGDWENVKEMKFPRKGFAAVNCNGILYAIGGQVYSNFGQTTITAEKYDFAFNKWEYISSMNFERRSHAACVMNGKIYVVGGLNSVNEVVKEIECYDPFTDCWSIVGSTILNLFNHSLITL